MSDNEENTVDISTISAHKLKEQTTKLRKKKENYFTFRLGYQDYIIPYSKVEQLLSVFESTEKISSIGTYDGGLNKSHIEPTSLDDFNLKKLSVEDYEAIKLKDLLNITFEQARGAL